MDDEQRKKLKDRLNVTRELVQKEFAFKEILDTLFQYYGEPMQKNYWEKYELLFKGVETVRWYSKTCVEYFNSSETNGLDLLRNDDAVRKLNIADFLESCLNKYIMCFKVFMKGTFEATEYLSKLNEKDPFRKWLEEQRSKIKDKLYLEDFLDRIRKHPGQIEMLISKIIKRTFDSDPLLPKLKEQQLLLKKNMAELDQMIDSQKTKEHHDLQILQSLIGQSIKIVIQTRHLITKGLFYCVFPKGVELLQFYLCNDLLLYGREQDKHYTILGRFYLVDSVVEREEGTNIITIQDNEKCLTFYSVDNSPTSNNEMGIEEWYGKMLSCIESMGEKQRLCGICNENCTLSSALQKELDEKEVINSDGTSSREQLKAVMCRGCGRCICEKCAVDMRSDPLQESPDQTVYCLHCRNWNKRDWNLSMSNYQTNPANDKEEWSKAVNRTNNGEYWYNRNNKQVSWVEPVAGESYDSSSVYTNQNNRWLTYETTEGKSYCCDMNTNQVQWKQTIEMKIDMHTCVHCGAEPKQWQVVCPNCHNRWSLLSVCYQETTIQTKYIKQLIQ